MLSSGYSQAAETLSLQTNARGIEAQLPDILSEADRTRYRKIFAIQERGDWRGADRLIKKLDKKLLLGHVMAQRYLHPTKYRSRYVELSRWMKSYADHPDAKRIYKLALSRKPRNYRPQQSLAIDRSDVHCAGTTVINRRLFPSP